LTLVSQTTKAKMSRLKELELLLDKEANPEKVSDFARFFKIGKGDYAEGDVFVGISVPTLRKYAKQYKDLSLTEVEVLLLSPIHEKRSLALYILAIQFAKQKSSDKQKIYNLYKKNIKQINNWDLVDESAPKIVGNWLLDKDRRDLYSWVKSKSLWERRISIMATFAFIRQNDFGDTFSLAEKLLFDTEDLIHKASGWMIREVYKKNPKIAMDWVQAHIVDMPRTMLRYAIEKVPEKQRQYLLKGDKS
jgi:3-methyladenine DNA glycosylase AlkD